MDPTATLRENQESQSSMPATQHVVSLLAPTHAAGATSSQLLAKRLPPQPITENCQSDSALGTLLTKIYPTATLKKPKTSTALKTSKSGSKAKHSKKILPSIDQSSNLNIYVPEIGF